MKFETFLKVIPKIEKIELSREEVHCPMAPEFRGTFSEDYRKSTTRNAAVMPIIYPKKDDAYMAFIQRPVYNGAHSGQIAFAGGKEEKEDYSFLETAFREVEEEIGVPKSQLSFLKELHSLYIPPSDFRVYPFLSYANRPLNFVLQKEEVDAILEVSLATLLNPKNKCDLMVNPSGNEEVNVAAYRFGSKSIWGATAMILHEVELMLKLSIESS